MSDKDSVIKAIFLPQGKDLNSEWAGWYVKDSVWSEEFKGWNILLCLTIAARDTLTARQKKVKIPQRERDLGWDRRKKDW